MSYSMKDIQAKFASMKVSPEKVRATQLEVFKPYFQKFMEAPKFKARAITMHDIDEFGNRLQRQAELSTVCNENISFSSQIGGSQTSVGLDYVTASEIENVLPLATVSQTGTDATMMDKFGVVRYEKIVAKTSKGNVTEEMLLQGAGKAPEVYPQGFASEMVFGEVIATADGSEVNFSGSLGTGDPIRPYYVTITLPGGSVITDDGNGHLIGDAGFGTVNYGSGAFVLNCASAPDAGDIKANFALNMELGEVPKIGIEFEGKLVKAHVYGLQSDTSILTNYLMKKMFNYDVQARSVEIVQRQILNEMVTDLIKKIEAAAEGYSLDITQFDLTRPQYISQQAHNETLDLVFKQVAKKMAKNSNWGVLSVAFAGVDATTVMATLSKFKVVGKIAATATLYGVYDDQTLVINTPQLAPSKVLFLGKDDSSAFLAAACQMVCMPLVTAEDIPASYNLTQRLTGCFTLAAIDVLNPQMIQQFAMVNTPYPVMPPSTP